MNLNRTDGEDHKKFLIPVIREKLYPTSRFPETLFPDLTNILIDLFTSHIKMNKEIMNLFQETVTIKNIRQKAEEFLNLENLLNYHPHTLVQIYHHMIKKFIFSKHQIASEREDILQEIITRLLADKIYRIQRHYNFSLKKKPSFTSYFMVIVRNIYVDIFRENKMRMLKIIDNHEHQVPEANLRSYPQPTHIYIEDECSKLHYILKMYHHSRPKIELCLKIKSRIQISADDIKKCFPECSVNTVSVLTQDFRFKTDRNVFDIIMPVFNRCERKKNRSDTLRKWISLKIDEIISHLNHTHEHCVYNSENVMDLFRIYYQKKE